MVKTTHLAADAQASVCAPLHAFAASLMPLGLPHQDLQGLFLRFEPMGRLRDAQGPLPATVGVLATWRPRSLMHGAIDCVRTMNAQEAASLLEACRASTLPVVNNLGPGALGAEA